MMRSLFSAVSGLKTHQTRMDVIGNNIANVNTEAFKASSVRFSELMYQTMSTASGGDASTGTGGVNAKQVGLGVSTASTMINITGAGSSETTGNPFDLKLSDSQTTNFFIVSDGTNTMFTRAGSFYVDGNGYLCMSSTGYTVQGWQVDKTTGEIHKDTVSPLQVMSPSNTTSAPEATTKAYVHGILDKEDTDVTGKDGYVMTLGFYDDLGYSYTAKFAVSTPKTTDKATGNNYFISLTDIVDSEGNTIIKDTNGKALSDDAKRKKLDEIWGADGKADDKATNAPKGYYMKYDANKGTFISISNGVGDAGANAVTAQTLKLSTLVTSSTTNNADGTTQKSNFKDINVDFSTSTNVGHGGKSTLKVERGTSVGKETGKKNGAMIGLSVDQSGKIYASYDNGNTELLGQIAVAQFANASGLEKIGDNCYQTTLNSGEFDGVGVAVDADGSKINSGQLEMSNVDLSGQFTDMIITQRGFQANSRVITVSDTLLEELINLKR
ncbi:flagellar hook protein FlgE [Roseburia faecis]|uniref:flagellar hook protein FlgE n=1 Tax=Roseburia faecis TaxID=301302 RepID=UPI003F94A0C7